MRKRFHGLKRVKVRQDWSRETLYNLSRLRPLVRTSRTFFQQKWAAKSMTRAFHGEQVKERKWERVFSKKLPAVAPLSIKYMASTDGSEQAEGRGSGLDIVTGEDETKYDNGKGSGSAKQRTPYMMMTYFPLERRLDVAVWRALFASSTRQARQFVIQGFVKVNGKPMRHPGYLLNPGDMFQVEPERVMWATGFRKANRGRFNPKSSGFRTPKKWLEEESSEGVEPTEGAAVTDAVEAADSAEGAEKAEAAEEVEPIKSTKPAKPETPEEEPFQSLTEATPDAAVDNEIPDEKPFNANAVLKTIFASARQLYMDPKSKDLPAKRKRELRAFYQVIKHSLCRHKTVTERTTNDLVQQLAALHLLHNQRYRQRDAPLGQELSESKAKPEEVEEDKMSKEEQEQLVRAIELARENPWDPSKPYMTPWRPRPFMSAFAFIPRYLEVNQNICSAVYLRHPVARPGSAEVPTPFPEDVNQLAFNWYLRRR